MQIEEGKYYRTREGRKVGPMVQWSKISDRPFQVTNERGNTLAFTLWHRDGKSDEGVNLDLIAEWTDESPKAWRDMADAEKGALLLARHRTLPMQVLSGSDWKPFPNLYSQSFECEKAYRIRPKPKRETVTLWIYPDGDTGVKIGTVDLIDGAPDRASIRIEPIE